MAPGSPGPKSRNSLPLTVSSLPCLAHVRGGKSEEGIVLPSSGDSLLRGHPPMSLRARTRREFYASFIKGARSGGASQSDIEQGVARAIREASELLAGRCPKCGAPSAVYVDLKRQQGPAEVPGRWVQYRCSTQPPPGELRPEGVCDFMADLITGEDLN